MSNTAIVGYARVSSSGQSLEVQVERLENRGCQKIFKERFTGSSAEREQLRAAIEYVREGDSFVVTKLDRLARSAVDLGQIAKDLQRKQVDLIVLDQNIDTTTPTGKLMFTMIGAFAEFERDLIRERCQEGIEKAKRRGVKFGRSPKLSSSQLKKLKQEFTEGLIGKSQLAEKYGISRASVYRLVKSR